MRPSRLPGRHGLILVLAAIAALLLADRSSAEPPGVHAIVHARVIAAPGTAIEDGTIVIRDGLIEAVGAGIKPPADAAVMDANGMTVTAGFIDACSRIGQKEDPPEGRGGGAGGAGGGRAAPEQSTGAVHPIVGVRPERKIADALVMDETALDKHRKMGFTAALTLPARGLFRGEAALINLGRESVPKSIVRPEAGQVIAFDTGTFGAPYPNSLMGAIAAIRQTLLDTRRWAAWEERYERSPSGMRRPEEVSAYAALKQTTAGSEPALFDVNDAANVARAVSISQEFSLRAVLIGSGFESLETGTLDLVKRSGYPMILPLPFPKDPKVSDPDEALDVSLIDLEKWDLAPENPRRVHEAGIPFALGTCRLDAATDFPEKLRKAIERGLTHDAALGALTIQAARILRADRMLGSIEKGKIANLAVFTGATQDAGVFAEKAAAVRVFVDGVSIPIEQKESKGDPNAKVDPRGTWSITLTISGRATTRTWIISGEEGHYEGTAETRDGTVTFDTVTLAGNEMTVKLPAASGRPAQEFEVIITGDSLEGSGEFPGGAPYTIEGKRTSGPEGGVL